MINSVSVSFFTVSPFILRPDINTIVAWKVFHEFSHCITFHMGIHMYVFTYVCNIDKYR